VRLFIVFHALLDCAGITNRLAVYKLQGLYLQSLYAYMKASRPGLTSDVVMLL